MIQGMRSRLALLAILLVGLGSDGPRGRTAGDEFAGPKAGRNVPLPQRVEAAGIENVFRLAPGIYSGAQPEGRVGFETLKRLGVKTIITVDGAWPDAEQAQSFGMRYVHLPVGYDGIAREQALRLVKAAQDLPGPLFVHCHHGMHRGPAAAALCVMATEGWDRTQARAWLEAAGTDPKYKGLYATVDQFAIPSTEELGKVGHDDLPEHADVPSLVETMVQVDKRWDRLKKAEKSDFRPPADQPDLDPAHEATLLAELFREAARQEDADERGKEFVRLMTDADRDATALETAILGINKAPSPSHTQAAKTAFTRMGRHCSTCHSHFRD